MSELIRDCGYQIKKGDAMEIQHAVMATAFSNFAALDKQWKRRIENLPKPNQNPRVYYEPELGEMVTDIEAAVNQKTQAKSASGLIKMRRNFVLICATDTGIQDFLDSRTLKNL